MICIYVVQLKGAPSDLQFHCDVVVKGLFGTVLPVICLCSTVGTVIC